MLNKKDPLIDAIQQVMQSNQADRDAVKAVNEKFGIQDRRVLPHERQGEWDAAYKTVLTEGVEALDEDWDSKKRDKGKRVEKAAKTIRRGRQGEIQDFAGEIAKRHKVDAVTGGNSADDAIKAMKQLYGRNRGDSKAIGKISEEEKLSSAQKHHMDVDDDNDIDSEDLKMKRMGMKEEKKMKGEDPCWDTHKMVGMKKGKGGKPVPKCVPVEEQDYSATQPSKMGLTPNYATGTPDYANKGPQMVNRAAKTSLPAGTMKEEEQIDEAGMIAKKGTIRRFLTKIRAKKEASKAEGEAFPQDGRMSAPPNFRQNLDRMHSMNKVAKRLGEETVNRPDKGNPGQSVNSDDKGDSSAPKVRTNAGISALNKATSQQVGKPMLGPNSAGQQVGKPIDKPMLGPNSAGQQVGKPLTAPETGPNRGLGTKPAAPGSASAKPPLPKLRPAAAKVKAIRKQPIAGAAQRQGVAARPARNSTVLSRVKAIRYRDKNSIVGPGN